MATIGIIGSGMGSLTLACLLAKDGHRVTIWEQNYLIGGCTSSYFRQGFIFEAGATTVVGLDTAMPLRYLLDTTGIDLPLVELTPSMQVHLANGATLTRYKDLNAWIAEAERVFGAHNQRAFWEYCYKISQFVWQTSLQQTTFPPSHWRDWVGMARNFRLGQLWNARHALHSTADLLRQFGLHTNPLFVDFVNEQLLITAQNRMEEVNILFGATALCYTNYSNYYIYGGLYQLVRPLAEYIEARGGNVLTRTGVERVEPCANGYRVHTTNGATEVDYIASGIPINNTLPLFDNAQLNQRFARKLFDSQQVNSAFQMGIGFRRSGALEALPLHHQIHLSKPLPIIGSHSIFLSVSLPNDWTRAPLSQGVASISTHVANPATLQHFDKTVVENAILDELEARQLLHRSDVLYMHSSTPASWERWTKRAWGFVGGYPQYLSVKPWQMLDARLDGQRAYICGDTVYPGQGIPGVCLSGILAYEKMKLDGLR